MELPLVIFFRNCYNAAVIIMPLPDLRYVECGAKPRESVTVKPLGDKSDPQKVCVFLPPPGTLSALPGMDCRRRILFWGDTDMPIEKERVFISTIDLEHGEDLAAEYGLGLELAEFCEGRRLDELNPETMESLRRKMARTPAGVFHAPFSELCPAAIDPLVRQVTLHRYRQSVTLARELGIRRVVIHSGFVPIVYFREWFVPESVKFWRAFLEELPRDMEILLENVMEEEPTLLRDIVAEVNDPRFRLCLDVGHANDFLSKTPVMEWIETCAPWIGHVHLHNNEGGWDTHSPLGEGTIPMEDVIDALERMCPGVSYTLENMDAAPSLLWLQEKGFLEK